VGGVVADPEQLIARRPETFGSRYAIDVQLHHEVVEIDPSRQAVRVFDHEAGAERWEPFDQLVVATGSAPVRPPLPGADATRPTGSQLVLSS
jgi:NADPH-dependent 2,4-dienoyl-CoA reductase/sulfur reductase-like enzyme